jgi:hypothetical protein
MAIRRRMGRGMAVRSGERRGGMRAWIAMRSDIMCWRFFSVVSGEERRKEGGFHLMKTIAETNSIGNKYLEYDKY